MFFYLDVLKYSKYQICRCTQSISGGRGHGRWIWKRTESPESSSRVYDPAFTPKIGQNVCFAKMGPTRKRR